MASIEPNNAGRIPPRLEAMIVATLLLIGSAVFYLLMRLEATGEVYRQAPVMVAAGFAAVWGALILVLVRWSRRHAGVIATLGPAGPWALISGTLPAVGGILLLVFMGPIGEWLRGHEVMGVVVYAVLFAVLAGFALLPTYAQAALGGWAFGVMLGAPAALLGFTGGAMIGYELGRRASGDRIVSSINAHPKWRAVRDELIGGGALKTFGLVTLLRVPPNSPFALTNLAFASARVPRVPYVLGTLIGMAPRTLIAVWLASQIEGVLNRETVPTGPAWLRWGGLALLIVVVLVISRMANRAVERVRANQESPSVDRSE